MTYFLSPSGEFKTKGEAGDLEVCQTNYRHPDITSGQHTNGPPCAWVRLVGEEWICIGLTTSHMIREHWTVFGQEWIEELSSNP